MFSWLKKTKHAGAPLSREALRLSLAMEWGKDWLQPIQERLTARHPSLPQHELDEINALCQAAMRFGHGVVYDLALQSGKSTKHEDFEAVMTAKYLWVSDKNLSHLFSQGMYYAWKDTGLA